MDLFDSRVLLWLDAPTSYHINRGSSFFSVSFKAFISLSLLAIPLTPPHYDRPSGSRTLSR